MLWLDRVRPSDIITVLGVASDPVISRATPVCDVIGIYVFLVSCLADSPLME